jgi:hypothetical protein
MICVDTLAFKKLSNLSPIILKNNLATIKTFKHNDLSTQLSHFFNQINTIFMV